MSSSNDVDLIASMENMEVKEDNADTFSEGDLVFAKSVGYIPWPGILVAKRSHQSIVNFLGSDETRRIDNAKIWPYNESTKAQYITGQNLEYVEFRDAVLIAENLSCVDANKENGDYCYRVLNKSDLQEEHEQENESQENESQEEASQEEASSSQEKSKKHPKEEHAEKENEDGDESGEEEPDHKESGMEALNQNDVNTMNYLRLLRSSRESLNADVEIKFIEMVNFLRHSLRINQKDYPSALLALQELQGMPFSELLLVRNFEAVKSIYVICFLDTAHRNYNEATQVKLLARQLITHIAKIINVPDTIGDFMDHFGPLSAIYKRYNPEFETKQRESSKEEYCDEFVAVEKDEQESLEEDGQESLKDDGQESLKYDGQDASAVGDDGQEAMAVDDEGHKALAVEEDGQESSAVEDDGQEAMALKDDGQEAMAVEDEGHEALAVKLDGQEALSMELGGQKSLAVEDDGQESLAAEKDRQDAFAEEEPMFSLDDYYPTSEIDDRFDELINILRRSLTFRQKDYTSALSAFDELLSFTFTKDFLMPKYKAVYFIYYLGRSGCVFPSNDLAKATLVRNLANQLMVRFFSVFNLPGITAYDFMVHFCSLYPETIPFDYDSD